MNDEYFMSIALQLASAAEGQTTPNPCVGAVVVKDGEIAGVGTHLQAGGKHAEIHALEMAGMKARGAELFVTLEPCCHYGKTPACTEAVIKAGIRRVVIASQDPNPLVSGKGATRLRAAGLQVETGLLKQQAQELNEKFHHFMSTGMPFVTIKQAITLDGKTAARSGESRWITGEKARLDVHRDRGKHAAVLTGAGTVVHDNPALTNRSGVGRCSPVRVILDTNLRIPPHARVLNDEVAPTWVITGRNACRERIRLLESSFVKVFQLEEDKVQAAAALSLLASKGISSVYVEGGRTLTASIVRSRLAGRWIMYAAPKVIGGNMDMVGDLGLDSMGEAIELQFESIEMIGEDLKIKAVFPRRE